MQVTGDDETQRYRVGGGVRRKEEGRETVEVEQGQVV